jgi:hypothetical protein
MLQSLHNLNFIQDIFFLLFFDCRYDFCGEIAPS